MMRCRPTSPPNRPPRARAGVRAAVLGLIGVTSLAMAGCGLTPSAADLAGSGQSQGDGSSSDQGGGSAPKTSDPAAVPSDIDPALAKFYEQTLSWSQCFGGNFQCAKLRVPLDYDKPGGRTIELAVLRSPATDQDNKRGSLVVNPGGPGGSGVYYASLAPLLFREPVKKHYDIVGFDPRGVARSAPVTCISDSEMDAMRAADASPDDPGEIGDLRSISKNLAAGCLAQTGRQLLQHLSTVEAARDMDVLRGALGDEKLTYYGASYGTFLGATYADLFTDRVGRMVLDGAIDPSLTEREVVLGQAKGFEVAVQSFIDECVASGGCPLGSSDDEAYDTLDDFLDGLDEDPLPTGTDRKLTQALGVSAVIGAMYSTGMWPRLEVALQEGLDGKGERLLQLADRYAKRKSNGDYKGNSGEAIVAVNCLDRRSYDSVAELRADQERFEEASPLFGEYILWGSLPCVDWPVKQTGHPHEIHAKGANPILVIGSTRDPATPYEWAVSLADQLRSGVLLTREGDGHTSSGGGVNQCVKKAISAFLVEHKVPDHDVTCPEP